MRIPRFHALIPLAAVLMWVVFLHICLTSARFYGLDPEDMQVHVHEHKVLIMDIKAQHRGDQTSLETMDITDSVLVRPFF